MATPDAFIRELGSGWPAKAPYVEIGAAAPELEAALREGGAAVGAVLRLQPEDAGIVGGMARAGLVRIDAPGAVLEVLETLDAWLGDPGAQTLLIRAEGDAVAAVASALAPHRYIKADAPDGWMAFHAPEEGADAVGIGRSLFDDDAPVDAAVRRQDKLTQIVRLREEVGESLALAVEARELALAYEKASVHLVGAVRRSRHDTARALADQKAALTADPAWAVGRLVLKARTPRDWLALPGKVAEARKAAVKIAKAAPPAAPTPLDVGPRIASPSPDLHTLDLDAGKVLYLAGRAIGPAWSRVAAVTARLRWLDAGGRPVVTGAEAAAGPAKGFAEQPLEIDALRGFRIALTPPTAATRLEIALAAERGDAVHVTLTQVEQADAETVESWQAQAQAALDRPSLIDRLRAIRDRPRLEKQAKAQAQIRRQVHHLKRRLLSLGFGDRAVQDFEQVIAETQNDEMRGLVAFELATWRANRYTADDARDCLRLLGIVETSLEMDDDWRRRIAILRAESQALLGDVKAAWTTLQDAMAARPHADLHLALTRLEAEPEARLNSVNQALALHGLETAELVEGEVLYDRLHAEAAPVATGARVTIIIPAYNAETTIGTAIRSLLEQSWQDVEILVSDDCSTDGTAAVVEAYAARDPRVKLIHGVSNSGPYVARNHALKVATGDFVTCNDSDDWSHPRKIELQARHLLANPGVVANTSPQARTSEDLVFHRRGNPGFYLQPNMSSLMFRRVPAMKQLGYWDSIRFGADSEFLRRLKAVFGPDAIVDLECGPLSFQRQTETSLTGGSAFGYHGFKMGARRQYEENAKRFHRASDSLYIDFPLTKRPFLAPEPMLPERSRDREARRNFDVVMVSDFRLPGGTNMSNAEEIKAQKRMGLKTGLVELSVYHLNPDRSLNPRILEQIDGDSVEMLVFGEKITCDLLIVRLPWVLEHWQEYVPDIEAKAVRVIVNQPPQRDYSPGAEVLCDIGRCADNLVGYFGQSGSWHPIGPLVRDALTTHHAAEMATIELGDIWPNIINVDEWRRPARPRPHKAIRIARHSRDQYVKWPDTPDTMLQVYPAHANFEIHVLGGAEAAREVMGGALPVNWFVTEFGEAEPRDFLADHDVFVYYTHPAWVESFGRVIFEAMAVGLPVFLPPIYEPLFKDAALYAEPHEVRARIEALMADDAAYQAQVERAWAYVEAHFGYAQHAIRLGAAMGRDLLPALTPRAAA
ncbi:glycosyltransferase [Brevundimonas sp. Leaf363]|uniref:glycosyltransferase n=1 Tax=Brevundimonas sp. Leaf363 TaxID=1736353 RepID=UPI000A98DA10|nr:glycosyltransferase [Brevundimonas sp. Leaf363]